MLKKTLIFNVIIFALATMLNAQNLQYIYHVDSPVYEMAKTLYLEAGFAPPEQSKPWSSAELIHILNRIPVNRLSANGIDLYNKLHSMVETRDTARQSFYGSISLEPNVEAYFHSNTEDYRQEYDWVYNYDNRKAMLNIPIEFFIGNNIYSKTDFAFLRTKYYGSGAGETLDSPLLYAPVFTLNNPLSNGFDTMDTNWPERAVIGLGYNNYNITIGRDDLLWSQEKTGSLTVSDHLDYYDFLKFSSFHNNFKYSFLIANFDSPSWISADQDSSVTDNDNDNDNNGRDNLKFYVAHRMEFRAFDHRLGIAITEAMIYQDASVNFKYLNPAMVFHNLYIRANANSTLAIEVTLNPYKYLTLYGNFLIDDIHSPGEDQGGSGARADAFGQQYGLEGFYPLGQGYLGAWFEFVKTDPYLYLRNTVDYIVNNRIFSATEGAYIDKHFMGYKSGNDTMLFAGGLSYSIANYLSAKLSATYMLKGEMNMKTEWEEGPAAVNRKTPYDDPTTPYKTIERSIKLSGRADYSPFFEHSSKFLKPLSFMTQIDYIKHWNKANISEKNTSDIQLVLGLNWKIKFGDNSKY